MIFLAKQKLGHFLKQLSLYFLKIQFLQFRFCEKNKQTELLQFDLCQEENNQTP